MIDRNAYNSCKSKIANIRYPTIVTIPNIRYPTILNVGYYMIYRNVFYDYPAYLQNKLHIPLKVGNLLVGFY